MKIKLLLIVIFVLITSNIYILYKYKSITKQASCYARKNKDTSDGIQSMLQMDMIKSLENLNLLFNNQNYLKLILHANSSNYLEALGNQDYSIYKPVEHNSTLCHYWTQQTKQQYKDTYLEIMQLRDFNESHQAMLKGLDIINDICLE